MQFLKEISMNRYSLFELFFSIVIITLLVTLQFNVLVGMLIIIVTVPIVCSINVMIAAYVSVKESQSK